MSPVLTARASGTRCSTARNTPIARCMSSSAEPWNQPSFDRLMSTSGWRPALGLAEKAGDHLGNRVLEADRDRQAIVAQREA